MCRRNSIMLSVFLNWTYIFFITQLIGLGFYKLMNRFAPCTYKFCISRNTVCGMVITTVYAQFFSLFYKVGLIANLILLVLCILIIFQNKRTLLEYLTYIKQITFSWDGVLYLGVLILFSYAASRGIFHTDTILYHARSIRWYEEVGVVKGLANLQWHFGYNSASFSFAALFSLSFLGIQSFHCTTSYIAAVFCIWSLYNLKEFSSHKTHVTDMCCVAILFYALVNLSGFMSPASDYVTMFFCLYLIARWAEEIESGKNSIPTFALLCVLAVFLCTLKLSVCPIILLTVYPAYYLIKDKQYKQIVLYQVVGIIVCLPFLTRNVLISGWLLYPFPAIDLFRVDWKLPIEYVISDSETIKVWAKCLYDTSLADISMREWIPIWWSSQERYAQMLLYCNVLAACLDVVILLHRLIKKEKININLILLNIVIMTCSATWFVLAPFIRYGLAFLLATPMLAVGMWLHKKEPGLYQLVTGGIVILMFFMGSSYWEHYFTDDMVFLKHNLTEPYYIIQKDYAADPDSKAAYYTFPCTNYPQLPPDIELRGNSYENGFCNKYIIDY